jgi:hypothetical protein
VRTQGIQYEPTGVLFSMNRKPVSPKTEKLVNKIVEKEFKLEKELKSLVKQKRKLYREDAANNSLPSR